MVATVFFFDEYFDCCWREQDTRHHKLFIVVSGGCHKLSDKFYNLSVDVRSSMTVEDVLESEESYYLKRVNGRSNARFVIAYLHMCFAHVHSQEVTSQRGGAQDPAARRGRVQAQDPEHGGHVRLRPGERCVGDGGGYGERHAQARCCRASFAPLLVILKCGRPRADLVRMQKSRQRDGKVTVLSKCMDTTRIRNGVVCSMHPSEGFWLFKASAFFLSRRCTHTYTHTHGSCCSPCFILR